MARPQVNTVTFFPHQTHPDDALEILWDRFRKDGFVFYYRTREKLGQTDGHFLDLRNEILWQKYLGFIGVSEVSTVEMINLLVEIGEIDRELWESKIIWWPNFTKSLAECYANRKRELPEKPVILADNEVITPNYAISTGNNGVPAGERKGEERRGKVRTTKKKGTTTKRGVGVRTTKKKGTNNKEKSIKRERGTKAALSQKNDDEKTTGKKNKDDTPAKVSPAVKKVENFLAEHRADVAGLDKPSESPEPKQEREYIQLMLNQGYSVIEICNAYSDYKEGIKTSGNKPPDNYWVDKFLSMKSLYKQIADWRKKKPKIRSNFNTTYKHLIGR